MGRRIVGIVLLLAVVIGGYLVWKRHTTSQELSNGDVHCNGCMTPEERARFLKENAGETADGASDHKSKAAQGEAATDFEDATPAQNEPRTGASTANLRDTPTIGLNGPRNAVAKPQASEVTMADSGNAANPDTLPPNVQNGSRFGGSGPYQWYRQGNITWRVNTATGRSCIIYATMEEWRKSIVLSHGCGQNA